MSGQRQIKVLEDIFYNNFMKFFETAEERRRWRIERDIPWEKVNKNASPLLAEIVESFCAVELYLPDYTSKVLEIFRKSRGRAWFLASWGYEESKHSMVLEKWLVRSGNRTEEQVQDFSDVVTENEWELPFDTPRQIMIYGMIQELATHINYKRLRDLAIKEKDEALAGLLRFISVDEMAHHGFYREGVKAYLKFQEDDTLADIAFVFKQFTMPAQNLIPNGIERAKRIAAAGIYGPREYISMVKEPIAKALSLGNIKELQRRFIAPDGKLLGRQEEGAELYEPTALEKAINFATGASGLILPQSALQTTD